MKLEKLERQEKKLAENVAKAFRSKNTKAMRSANRAYLNSYACRFVATRKVIESSTRRSHKSAEEIARDLNVWIGCDEVAKLNVVLKDVRLEDGDDVHEDIRARVTVDFGIENRARQILVREMLRLMWRTSCSQTLFNGGRNRAVRLVKEYYADGYQYVVEGDVYRCFQSFDKQGISNFLRLPEKVVENVLGASSLKLRPSLRQCRQSEMRFAPDTPLAAIPT
jgi:hypothetical protein